MSSKNSNVPAREREFTSEEERTIERSKQVIDLATTIASGDQPSNVQLKKAIAAGKAGLEEAKQKTELQGTLYPEGEAFVTDAKALLTDAQLLLDEKNRDEKFQKFASDAQNLIDLLKAQAPAVGAQVQLAVESREPKFTETFEEFLPEQRELMQQVVTHLRVLLSTTVRSGEFRSLVVDTMDLMRSLFIGGTEQLQQTVDSKLAQMQQNFQQQQQPLTSQTLPSQIDVPSLLAAPATGSQNVQFTPAVQQAHLASTSLSGIQQPTASLSLQGPKSGYYKDMYGTSKTFAYSSMKQDFRYETKKIVDQFLDILGRYTHQKEFSEALKAEIDLLSAFQSTLKREAEQVAESVKSSTRNIWASRQFQLVYTDAVNIIEAFTGANTWSPFWKSLTRWLDFIQNDMRTRTYFYEWKTCFYEVLDDPQKLSQEQFHNRLVDLIDRGRSLSYELKWSTYTQDIFKLALEMIDNVVNDPLLTRISRDTQKLMANLVTNEQGNLAFKPELMQQINEIFVTLFTQQMQFIPISEIRDVADGTLGKYDYILKNIVFRAEDILPEHMHIRTTNDVDFNVKSFTTNSAKTDIYIKIDQIKFHLHNVEFWYKRLSTPKMEDSGFVDVDMAGDGAEIVVHVIVNPPSQQPIFDVQKIQCTIHDLTLKTKESKHDTMYSVVSGLFAGMLKRYIQDKVESELTRNIAILNNKLNQLIEVLPQQESLSSLVTQQVKAVIGLEPSAAEQPRKAPSAVV